MPLFLSHGSRNWWPVACILLGQLWPCCCPAGVIIFIGLTFCDTIYFSTENEPPFLFVPSCWAYIQVTVDWNLVGDVLRTCQNSEKLCSSPKDVTQSFLTSFIDDWKLQNAWHCIISTFLKDKFSCSLGKEEQIATSHTLHTRRLIAHSEQELIQSKPSGPTCVVASPKCWPGPMVLPKVAQIPITLVLH